MSEYREEILNVSKYKDEDCAYLANSFNEQFLKKDAYIQFRDNELHIFLFQLDMKKYKDFLSESDIDASLAEEAFETVNKIGSYGVRGSKRHFSGYNSERKVTNRKAKEANRGKHYYANDNEFSKKNNSLPVEYENRIVRGDSLEILRELPDNCVDIIFTSPPYNFGLDYDNHNDTSNWDRYFETLFDIFTECIRVLKYGGRFVVNVQPLYSDYIPVHHIISDFL